MMRIERSRIFLTDYEVKVSIGIYDFEKTAPQRILINVELDLDTARAVQNDHIDTVLDYDFLRNGIASLIRDRHFNLQETLCRAVVDLCLSRAEVQRARVTTSKPDIYPDCRDVGYEMIATRD